MSGVEGARANIGFGCVNLGSVSAGRSWRADVALVREAISLGVRTFDTADAYGCGVSERIVGRAVRAAGADVVVATKVGYCFRERSLLGQSTRRLVGGVAGRVMNRRSHGGGGGHSSAAGGSYQAQDFSPEHIRSAVAASRARLGVESLDILQLHGPRDVRPEVVEVAAELIASGAIRRFGIGAESVDVARAWLDVDVVSMVQVPFGLLDPEAAEEVLPAAAQRGVEVWARGVLGGGLLTIARDEPGRLAGHHKTSAITALQRLAEREGTSVFQLAFDFARTRSEISTVLLGMQSIGHVRDNLAMLQRPPVDGAVLDEAVQVVNRGIELR